MKDCNKTFQQLRERVPFGQPAGKRVSKIESLRMAIKYIKHLKYLLSFPEEQEIPAEIVAFDPTSDAWDRVRNTQEDQGDRVRNTQEDMGDRVRNMQEGREVREMNTMGRQVSWDMFPVQQQY